MKVKYFWLGVLVGYFFSHYEVKIIKKEETPNETH